MKKLKIVLGVIGVILVIGGGFYKIKENQAIRAIKTQNKQVSNRINQDKPISFLLLGADTGSDGRVDRGLSDSMMVVTLNPKTKKTLVYSIPRDSLAEMVGSKTKNVQKINAAYELGQAKMAKKTVSEFIGVPIDYSVTIDMGALKELVDFVDGVDVKTNIDVSFDGQTIKKGRHHLNGKQALVYTRMRYQDPRGDYGRQLRQQEVLRGVADKIQKPQYLVHLSGLMTKLGKHISTDLTADQTKTLIENYHQCGTDITSGQIIGKEAWINGSSYQVIATDKLQATSNKLRESLGLQTKTLSNTETKLNQLNTNFFKDDSDKTFNTDGLNTTYYSNNTY